MQYQQDRGLTVPFLVKGEVQIDFALLLTPSTRR